MPAVDLSEVRDGEPITKEDLENLMSGADKAGLIPDPSEPSDLEMACAGGLKINVMPATIELDNDSRFIVTEFNSWGYCPYGVFAKGEWETSPEADEKSLVFNGDVVRSIELDIKAYEDAIRKQIEEAESSGKSTENSSD